MNLKDTFLLFAKTAAHSAGYPFAEEEIKGSIFLSRNLIAGDPEKAGYRCVRGYAEVDPADGSNRFTEDPAGPHRYVVKLREDACYAAAIDARLPKEAVWPDLA